MQQLPGCLSAFLGHGCPVILRFRWLWCPAHPLQTEASQGARACALGWHFGTGCCLPEVRWRQGIAAVDIIFLLRLQKREDQICEHYKDTKHPSVGYCPVSHCPLVLKDTVLSRGWEDWHQQPQILSELWWPSRSLCRSR